MLFGGFYINVTRIPSWLAQLRYASFMYWGFSGMVINEFRGRELPCSSAPPGLYGEACPFPGDRVVEALGYQEGTVGRCLMMLLIISCFFRCCAYLCLRFNLNVRV